MVDVFSLLAPPPFSLCLFETDKHMEIFVALSNFLNLYISIYLPINVHIYSKSCGSFSLKGMMK